MAFRWQLAIKLIDFDGNLINRVSVRNKNSLNNINSTIEVLDALKQKNDST